MIPTHTWSLLALTLAAAPASAERFQYRYRPGQTIQTRASMAGATLMGPTSGSQMKMQYRVTLKQTQRVRSVSGNVVTLEIADVPVKSTMTAMGRTQQYKRPATKSIVKVTQRGKFLSRKTVSGEEDASGADGMEGADALYGLNFPDRDLKPGDTWEDTVNVGNAENPQLVKMTSKYLSRGSFRGRDCARFQTTISMPMAPDADETAAMGGAQTEGRLTGTLTTYFDPKAGIEVYSSGTLTMMARADLSALGPEGGEIATATKINVVQYLAAPARGRR